MKTIRFICFFLSTVSLSVLFSLGSCKQHHDNLREGFLNPPSGGSSWCYVALDEWFYFERWDTERFYRPS